MNFQARFFSDLSATQVYEMLKSRSQIFMLEQNIHCLDMDDVDYVSLHCFMEKDNRVSAYLRAFYTDDTHKYVKIGRVLTLQHGNGIGRVLMQKSISAIRQNLPCDEIVVDAQVQAVGYYEKMGFIAVSDTFIEEGIPHIVMKLAL